MILDAQGNTYVTGFITNSQGYTETFTAKIDLNGSIVWERTYNLPNHHSKGLKLSFDSDGWVELLGEITSQNDVDILLARYSPNGNLSFARKVDLVGDQRGTDVLVDYSHNIYVTGQTVGDSIDDYFTMQYDWSENEMPAVLNSQGEPAFVDDELIIRFNPDEMLLDAVDDIDMEFGALNEFVSTSVIDAMNQFVHFDFGKQTCYKIFRTMTSNDTIAKGRQGNLVRQPRLWSALNVQIPTYVNKATLQDSLESLFPLIYYTDLNLFGEFLSNAPNDTYYNSSASLHSTTSYGDTAHINIEKAWGIETGNKSIRVGVFDSGIEWDHEDFQFQGNSVVQDVWDMKNNVSWMTNPHADSNTHGTKMSSIIGSVRNNGVGLAGIAGGHDSSNAAFADHGVELYGWRIYQAGLFNPVLTYLAAAIEESTFEGGGYQYGIHLQNHSWGIQTGDSVLTDTNITLLRDAVKGAYRNGTALFCARGNQNVNNTHIPATFDDKWVMNIGGSGVEGNWMNGDPSNCEQACGWGNNVDIVAPATSCLIPHTALANFITNSAYASSDGTSSATAHATGTAALLCSYLNDSASGFALAPEDIEWIIQLSATDVGPQGEDDHTGHGRLNAGAALQLVEKPDKKLEHHGTVSTSGSVSVSFETTSTVNLAEIYETEAFQVFQDGTYQMDRYKISAVVNHSVDTTDSIIAYWTRNDRVTTLPLPASGILTPHEECFITAMSETQASLEGYVYHVKTLGGTPIGWIPQDTSAVNAALEYTLLIHPKVLYQDTTGDTTTVINQVSISGHNLLTYPNPASSEQQIELNLLESSEVTHILRSIHGSLIRMQSFGTRSEGKHTFSIDISDLSSGIYLHEVHLGQDRLIKRFTRL